MTGRPASRRRIEAGIEWFASAGPKLLARILVSKYGLHLPLNRQSTVYAREGVDLDVSTLAE